MSNEIICPYCDEEQEYQDGRYHSEVFFSEGNHKLECYQCGEVFRVNAETRYVYEVEELEERKPVPTINASDPFGASQIGDLIGH